MEKTQELPAVESRGWAVVRWVLAVVVGPPVLLEVLLFLRVWSPRDFRVDWLALLIFLACLQSSKAAGEGKRSWIKVAWPAALSAAIYLASLFVARRFEEEPSPQRLLSFDLTAAIFLLVCIAWILLFPFEAGLREWRGKGPTNWYRICVLSGMILGFAVVSDAVRLYRVALIAGIGAPTLAAFQSRAVLGAILIFYLLVFRAWVPKATSDLISAMRAPVRGR